MLSVALSILLVTACSAVLSLSFKELDHWFMVPVTASGILVGIDVAEWTRRRLDSLEPRAIVAIFGLHFFYAAPILHVLWDFWPSYVTPAQDWKHSLGMVAAVNALGLLLYRVVLSLRPTRAAPRAATLALDERRFRMAIHAAIAVCLVAFSANILRYGGPLQYISTVTDRGTREALAGTGWLLVLAEAWPLLMFVLIAVRHRTFLSKNVIVLALLILGFALLQFAVGGLRGSRANTVWPLLIALGTVHLVVRPIRRLAIALVVLSTVGFAWIYGLYKVVGTEVVGVLHGATSVTMLSQDAGRSFDVVLLGDFGRAGVQALIADRLERGDSSLLAWGESYLGDLALLVPIPGVGFGGIGDKAAVGTNFLYGTGAYESGFESTRIYGLVGEAMMNFGFAGSVLVFVVLASIVRWVTRIYSAGGEGLTVASILAPPLAAMCILVLVSDLDNVIWFCIKHVLPLAAVVALSTVSRPRT